jgi:hypothetical protein
VFPEGETSGGRSDGTLERLPDSPHNRLDIGESSNVSCPPSGETYPLGHDNRDRASTAFPKFLPGSATRHLLPRTLAAPALVARIEV